MTDYANKAVGLRADADKHCLTATRLAGLHVSVVITSAILAAAAAVTSQTAMPTWVTTATAGLSAALAVITAAFNFQEKSSTHKEVAADLDRLAERYEQLVDWHGPALDGQKWLNKLGYIENQLAGDHPVPDEADWAAARVPASSTS